MPVYVPRTKDQRVKLARRTSTPLRTVTLTCGHTTDTEPALERPRRWWCCGQWRRAR